MHDRGGPTAEPAVSAMPRLQQILIASQFRDVPRPAQRHFPQIHDRSYSRGQPLDRRKRRQAFQPGHGVVNLITAAQPTAALRRLKPSAFVTLAAMAALPALTAEATARQARPAPATEATAPRDAGEPIMAIVSIKAQKVTRKTVATALLAYEGLRRERVGLIQRGARESGLRYDSANPDLGVRCLQLHDDLAEVRAGP
jgi:hypothetical protein